MLAIVVLTSLVGVILSDGKKKRMTIYNELYEFNERLILNMRFSREGLENVASDFKYVLPILRGDNVLYGTDGRFLKEYALNLGKTDPASQIDYLTEKKSQLKKYKEESFSDYKKYGSLYIKIFFMIGVMLAVLLA